MPKTFADIQLELKNGRSVVEITKDYLTRIHNNNDLNAFLEVFDEGALQQAAEVDEKLANGTAGNWQEWLWA